MMNMDDLFEGQMTDPKDTLRFIYAGNALFTLVSKKTGARFTYRIRKSRATKDKESTLRFVKVLNGPGNESQYLYLGYIKDDTKGKMFSGAKGRPQSPSFKALDWAVEKIAAGVIPNDLEFYHSGKCGCCGRTLTVPESIKSGLGPVCAARR
jgi:hypothetical protein